MKGCVQQARKWLFRPKFFSLSKWAQFLHVTLDLTGKRCPVIFSAVFFFVFEKFSSTSTGGKCALRWFYRLEKQKLSLERTPPGKKLRFCIRYLWKMKEKPADLNGGLCFSIKWKATCRNWAHLDEEKNFGLKSHLRACCTQPFKCFRLRMEMDYNFKKSGHLFQVPPLCLGKIVKKTHNKRIVVCSPIDNSLGIFVLLSLEHFVYKWSYLVIIPAQYWPISSKIPVTESL